MRVFLVLFMTAVIFAGCSGKDAMPGAQHVSAVKNTEGNEQFIFNISTFDDGKAHYYKIKENGKEIRFFLVKAKDGAVRAALDACTVCYDAKKGYRQEGGNMVCMNCGMKFHLDKINELSGGCNPVPLAREFNNGKIYINKDDVVKGAEYF